MSQRVRVLSSIAGAIAVLTASTSSRAADAAAGQAVFRTVCGTCHSVQAEQNKIGPTLFGIVGRKSGTVPGYNYSTANVATSVTWDAATLDTYLRDPRAMVPGTKMTYAGLKDDSRRADVIAYLSTLN